MATIDVSLDELTGATIIITTAIISTTDRSRDRALMVIGMMIVGAVFL
jgi:hypothetical protein